MDIYVRLLVARKKENMKRVKDKELQNIHGGGISASFITAAVRAINSLLDLGRSLGTAVRRIRSGSICSL